MDRIDASLSKEETKKSSQIGLYQKFIRCSDCGEEIRMIQSLSEMIEAIENHLTIHGKPSRNESAPVFKGKTALRQDLTDQVLQRAAEMTECSSNNSVPIGIL
jgi:hypothetical protein